MIAGILGHIDGSMWGKSTVALMVNQEAKKGNAGALLSPSPL